MLETVEAPLEYIEALRDLRLTRWSDARLRNLMDRSNEGQLTVDEHEELATLVEWSERLSLIRTEAFRLLAKQP